MWCWSSILIAAHFEPSSSISAVPVLDIGCYFHSFSLFVIIFPVGDVGRERVLGQSNLSERLE